MNLLTKMAMALAAMVGTASTHAQETTSTSPASTPTKYASVYEIPVEPMKAEGGTKATSLGEFKGKALLVVNVASKCGYTKQYEGLEALYKKYKDQGLVVVGFPSNDFKGQEPGTEEEIVEFCKATYGVTFPLFAKVNIKGEDKSPLYQYLQEGDHAGKAEVSWNFNKYLVGRDGQVMGHYPSKVTPDDPNLVQTIEAALAKK